MSEKEEIVFDADVYRRLEFLERRFNALVEETHNARTDAQSYAFASLCVLILTLALIMALPFIVIRETPSPCPATVGELVKTLETVDPETPIGKGEK
ncbi:MAG: hypothetical protein IKU86_12360 [Thermoguttaceae bacterium]|nr:hypothetical protein [Thermoguttaceae bacterium]